MSVSYSGSADEPYSPTSNHAKTLNVVFCTFPQTTPTKHLGQIVHDRQQQGRPTPLDQLAHLSPLGWEHIILTGFYKW